MKYKSILILSLVVFCGLFTLAQQPQTASTELQSFNFFYVDNSHGAHAEGMNDSLYDKMLSEIRKLVRQNDKGFALFKSNGSKPQIIKDKGEVFNFEFRTDFFNQSAAIPNFSDDKKYIRDYFYDNKIHVTKALNFHFFLSENSLHNLFETPNSIITNFVRELSLYSGDASIEVNVTLYFSKNISSTSETSLSEFLNYYNSTTSVPLKINYRIVQS